MSKLTLREDLSPEDRAAGAKLYEALQEAEQNPSPEATQKVGDANAYFEEQRKNQPPSEWDMNQPPSFREGLSEEEEKAATRLYNALREAKQNPSPEATEEVHQATIALNKVSATSEK